MKKNIVRQVLNFLLLNNPPLHTTSSEVVGSGWGQVLTGRSRRHAGHVRGIKKAQRRRAHLRSLRG